jgi:AcrR family transcriptional regulator
MPRLSHAERRRQILGTAMQVFAEYGFRGTTTKTIAGAAGISEATIFLHFPTKEDLFDAILAEGMPSSPPAADVLKRAAGRSLRQALIAFAERALHDLHRNRALLRLLVFSALQGHSLANRLYRRHVQGQFAGLAELLRRAQARGEIRKVDPETAARLFTTAIIQQIIVREIFGGPAIGRRALHARIEAYVDLYLEGILPRKARR